MAVPQTPCRWVRPLPKEPGHWKKQLAGKHLKLAERGQLRAVKTLLDEHPEYLNKRGSHGRTLLWSAIRHGRFELASWLISQGADVNLTGSVNSESFVQLSPLAACEFYHRPKFIAPLEAHGAVDDLFRLTVRGRTTTVLDRIKHDPTLLAAEDPEDKIYHSPLLTFSIVGGHDKLSREIVELGFEVSAYSFQLLFVATHFGRKAILELLLERGARVENADASLWMATNDLDILRLLVQHGLSPNQRPNGDLTPLLYASRADKGTRTDKLQLLLALGADVGAKSKNGRTALHYAVMSGNAQACEMLLDAGIDPAHASSTVPAAAELAEQQGHAEILALIRGR